MLDIRSGLRAFLLADAAVAAVVSTRIFPTRMPQGEKGTSIVYLRISGLGDHTLAGASRISRPRFQIDCWAQSPGAAADLANLVKERLDGYRGEMPYGTASPQLSIECLGVFFENERDGFDADNEMFVVSRDYFVWHREMS